MRSLEQENAILEAQRAYAASDAWILERAAVWRGVPPGECFAAVIEQCESAAFEWSRKDDSTISRIRALDALPEDAIAILEAMQRAR